jgi:hypothetical protein
LRGERLEALDRRDRLVDRLEHFDAAREHRRGGIGRGKAMRERRARRRRAGRKAIGVQCHPRERPDQIRTAAATQPRVQRRRVRQLHLLEGRIPLARRRIETLRGDDASLADRILARMPERDQLDVLRTRRHRQCGEPAQQRLGFAARAPQLVAEFREFRARGDAMEAADLHADGIHRTAAEQDQDAVAEFSQPQRALYFRSVQAGDLMPSRCRKSGAFKKVM